MIIDRLTIRTIQNSFGSAYKRSLALILPSGTAETVVHVLDVFVK